MSLPPASPLPVAAGYVAALHRSTPTRLWINNPTPDEARRALALGVRSCTTNPTYTAKILKTLGEPARQALLSTISAQYPDPDQAVDAAQRMVLSALLPLFAPALDPATPYAGLVSIQGNPHCDTDAVHMLHEAAGYAALGPNVIFKIPATRAGLEAIESLLREGRPVLATEMMSVAQVLAACAVYRRVQAATGRSPVLILTHITGIYDQYLGEQAARLAPELPSALVAEAGVLIARRCAAVLAQSQLPIGIMGGGARHTRHLTELVGGPYQVTVNPDMVEALVAANQPPTPRFHTPTDPHQVERLSHHLPDFRRAWEAEGLRPEEFEQFGPIRLFLSMFTSGWDQVRAQFQTRSRSHHA